MGFISGLGGLLGGITAETQQIKKERFDKENADMNMTMSMLQHIVDNPNIQDPSIKAHAQNSMRDVLFEHLFPDQFKGDTKNPVRKLVDQFVGQTNNSPAMASAMQSNMGSQDGSQPGVGRGNAQPTQLGGTSQPQQPPAMGAPLPPPMGTQASGAGSPNVGLPPSPQSALAGVPTVGGFASPLDIQGASLRQQGQIEMENKLNLQQQQLDTLRNSPAYKQLQPQQQAQAEASLMGGHVELAPVPGIHAVERYDATQNKTFTDTYRNTATGLEKVDSVEHPPSPEMQKYADDAKALFDHAQTDPKSPFKGMSEMRIREELHMQDFQNREQVMKERVKNMETNETYKHVLEGEITDKEKARQDSKISGLTKEVAAEASKRFAAQTAAYNKSGGLDYSTGKAVKISAPTSADYDRHFDAVAQSRGIDPDVLRRNAIQMAGPTATPSTITITDGQGHYQQGAAGTPIPQGWSQVQ